MNPVTIIRDLFRELLDQPVDELVFRLTLLTLILHGSSSAWLDVPLKILCGYMLISRVHFNHRELWILVCALVWWVNATDWLWIDNHKYLISYWALVCAIAAGMKDAPKILAWNGRVLLGLAFAFATLWKLVAGQYWNGEFLYYTLLVDGRMEILAHWLGGISKADLSQARMAEDTIGLFPSESVSSSLPDSRRLWLVAIAMSWWTLLIEAAIAVAFLIPQRLRLSAWRDVILMSFIAATYVIVPVLGFGYILTILGLAACSKERTRTRAAYLVMIVVVQFGRLFERIHDWAVGSIQSYL